MLYKCQKCKNDCSQLYSDKKKKKGICEKCYVEEREEAGETFDED